MSMKNLNVRVDAELKAKAEKVFSELGMNMSTALTIFLKTSVRYGGIPFELRLDEPNRETLQAIDDVNNNRGMSRTFNSVEELMVDLNAEN
ncbi:DNA-damage-inducible protein J [Desulfonispora thiosulfatigenes DSM 11270]|uniref:DNA-damage-inducible protein J n=1 Tax=Desulfonispora thiosulfatigenes DSM 11270 TaxID=656914 RepID=A0A1W1UWK4_DESTI|nr:type II toxin-antitoxin system RelB/DinJ family antitoxin [Desulfonispora thiosulfatigenes]SMB85074.1 DNA-damage-inducible protein J [Desulfonispora thiosulfatigenes DSM 11270]